MGSAVVRGGGSLRGEEATGKCLRGMGSVSALVLVTGCLAPPMKSVDAGQPGAVSAPNAEHDAGPAAISGPLQWESESIQACPEDPGCFARKAKSLLPAGAEPHTVAYSALAVGAVMPISGHATSGCSRGRDRN